MELSVLKALNEARAGRRAAVLLTDLTAGTSRLVSEGESLPGPLGEALGKALRSGRSTQVEADGKAWFLNAHLPPPRIVIIGAVHISQALAPMARIAGFDIEIIDPRTAFATPARFADTALHADWPQEVLLARPLDSYTALAALTHDPKIDDHPLQAALEAGCFYVGALGSRKTHGKRLERLKEAGVPEPVLERIRAPIGLNIGAATPAEIAVAILAEVIGALRSRGLQEAAS